MKNFTKTITNKTLFKTTRWLIMALMLLVGTSSVWAGTNWQGKIYFKAPDSWNLSTNSKVQIVLTQSSSASSGTKYAYVVGTMEKVTGSDRLYFYSSINTDHGNWGTEYIAFIANSTAWNTGDFYINSCAHYTAPSSYRATDSNNYYLYKASTESVDKQSTTANNVSLSGSYNSSRRTILNEAQTINLQTNSSSSGIGGKVKITGRYDSADKTLSSSSDETDGTASDKTISYADAAIGSKIELVATPASNYKFDGWYDDGTIVSSSTSYSYIVYGSKTLEARFTQSCTPSATLSSAVYDAENNEIDLSGSIAPCGKELFYGFLWKNKNDANWNTANAISGTGGSNNKTTEDIDFNQSWDSFTPGDTYEFTAYALDATTNPYTWYYSTNENDILEVETCTSIPDNAYAIAGNNVWTGNANPVTINYDANTYGTPTILYDGEAQIPTDVGTYAITINVPAHNGYCASTISLGDYEITCIDVEKPAITTSATVCAGTQVTLSNYNGVNDNTVKVKWYSDEECNSEVTEQVTLTDNGTKYNANYYAKAYHEASGCYSSEYSTLTFTVNPLPTISISDNPTAVLYEDVTLTATATDGAIVKWYEDDDDDEKGEGLTYVVTSETATSKAVTAKAFLNGCESATTKTVIFSAEDCNSTTTTEQQTVGKTKIIVDNPQNWSTMKCYAWRTSDKKKILGDWSGTNMNKNGNNYEIVIDFAEKGISESDKIQVIFNDGSSQTVDSDEVSCNKIYRFSIGSKSGDKYSFTSQAADIDPYTEPVEITVDPEITAPAAKTISVSTTDGEGNIIFSGQVVKTGCADALTYGFAYSTDANADKNNWTKVECANTGNTAGIQYNGEKTGIEVDGTYYVCAYITNSAGTTYGAVTEITISTTKTSISNVTLNYCDEYGEDIDDPNPMCKGATAYVKLSYVGSKYSDIKWLVEGVETNLVTDKGDGVWSYIIQGDGSLSVELRNDANKDNEDNPTWATSNKLSFTMKEEPTAPYISIDPASGVLCEGYTATITVTNPSTDCAYKLVEEGSKAGFTDYESGDLKYSVGSVGKYYVAAKHIACPTNEYTSNQVEINQIISTSASISIEPATSTTTPWEPVTITVNPEEGYVYELSYTDNNLAGVEGVIIKQNGDSYTYYIPRPDSWGTGDSNSRTTIGYDIKATLKVEGEATQCQMSETTATITLKDEDNENCE